MKRFLLLSALVPGVISAGAQSFGDYFKVLYNGEEVTAGSTVVVDEAEYSDEWGETWGAHINVVSLRDEVSPLFGEALYVEPSTRSLLLSDAGCRAKLCFSGADGGLGNCLFNGTETMIGSCFVNLPAADTDTFEWTPDLEYDMSQLTNPVIIRLNMMAAEGNAEDGDARVIDGTDFSVTIKFESKFTGIASVGDDNGVTEYYNMQGVRVATPTQGLYIVKHGDKVVKQVF